MILGKMNLPVGKHEKLLSVQYIRLTTLQFPMKCDMCSKSLPKDAQALGKIVTVKDGTMLGARFSPTCLCCAGLS